MTEQPKEAPVDVSGSPFRSDLMSGDRVLITGGGSGLGRGMAAFLAAHGAQVHLWGRRESALAEAAAFADSGARSGGRAHFQTVDIRGVDSIETAMQAIWDDHGPLTGLINNAAANFVSPTEDISPNGFEAIASTVMDGTFHVTQAAGRKWIAAGLPGSIISTLATWVWTGSAYTVPSAMSKSAIHAMTMSLAVEWAKYGIRLNAIAPGPFPTEFTWTVLGANNKANKLDDGTAVPAGRQGEISELANLAMFLLAGGADYITGQSIAIDGGQMFAGPGTMASLTQMSQEEWDEQRAAAKKATAESKAQRSV